MRKRLAPIPHTRQRKLTRRLRWQRASRPLPHKEGQNEHFQRHDSFDLGARAARTRLGSLAFVDGVPTAEAAEKVYDHLDFLHGSTPISMASSRFDLRHPERLPRRGSRGQPGPHLLGADGLGVGFLTERRHGLLPWLHRSVVRPIVVEIPPQASGRSTTCGGDGSSTSACRARIAVKAVASSWSHRLRWAAARQRLPHRALPHIADADGCTVVHDGRRPGADRRDDQRTLKIYPFAPGAAGTSIATLLEGGGVNPAPLASVPETVFVEGSGKAFNTVPPSDFGFFS